MLPKPSQASEPSTVPLPQTLSAQPASEMVHASLQARSPPQKPRPRQESAPKEPPSHSSKPLSTTPLPQMLSRQAVVSKWQSAPQSTWPEPPGAKPWPTQEVSTATVASHSSEPETVPSPQMASAQPVTSRVQSAAQLRSPPMKPRSVQERPRKSAPSQGSRPAATPSPQTLAVVSGTVVSTAVSVTVVSVAVSSGVVSVTVVSSEISKSVSVTPVSSAIVSGRVRASSSTAPEPLPSTTSVPVVASSPQAASRPPSTRLLPSINRQFVIDFSMVRRAARSAVRYPSHTRHSRRRAESKKCGCPLRDCPDSQGRIG